MAFSSAILFLQHRSAPYLGTNMIQYIPFTPHQYCRAKCKPIGYLSRPSQNARAVRALKPRGKSMRFFVCKLAH